MAETKTKKKTAPLAKNTKGKKSAASAKEENSFLGEILTIIAAVLGVFVMVSLWFNAGGMIGGWTNTLLKGLFGCGAYIIPIAVISASVCHFAVKDESKTTFIALLFLLICVILHYMYVIDNDYIKTGIKGLWLYGTDALGGGVVGGIIAEPLVRLLGKITCAILLVALTMIDVILLFKVSVFSVLGKFFRFIGRNIRDCFVSVGSIDDDNSFESFEDKKGETHALKTSNAWENTPNITILPPTLDDEEEISINNPLDFVSSNEDTKLPEIKEQLPLEPADDQKTSAVSVDEEIVKQLDENKEQPMREYVFPGYELLDKGVPSTKVEKVDKLKENAARLLEILESFGVEAKITNVTRGSSVTRFEVVPASGVKVSKITALDQDIAMRLPAQNVRIEVLQGSVGIEASNDKVSSVYIRDIIESKEFINHPSKLAVALGRDIDGKVVVVDISKTPHLLIAGATGSGKSVCINAMITSILYKSTPDEVRLVMVDPKVVELGMYNGIPHLLVPIVTDPRKAAGALCWAVNEMEERYGKFAKLSVRNISGYNEKLEAAGEKKLPQIVIIIDELADLMMVAPGEVQDYICRLAQKARAAGMHLILATQRPSVDVITGLIKANIPSRFSFQVSSHIDSRTILDCGGAEKLMGRGDMLMMLSSSSKLLRVQGAYVSDDDVERVTAFIKNTCDADYSEDIQKSIEGNSVEAKSSSNNSGEEIDELFDEAVDIAFELDQISTSMLQRRLKIGYARAGRLIDLMDKMQVISSYDGSNKPRTLRMTREQFYAMRAAHGGESNGD
ncbi:MAG: DNA translocase FtsK 4TM domain-containing protein [Bacillota bacterium]|nr:DNA translocase FtsK 4TM domain-containing protein [Bacillota bacterium]